MESVFKWEISTYVFLHWKQWNSNLVFEFGARIGQRSKSSTSGCETQELAGVTKQIYKIKTAEEKWRKKTKWTLKKNPVSCQERGTTLNGIILTRILSPRRNVLPFPYCQKTRSHVVATCYYRFRIIHFRNILWRRYLFPTLSKHGPTLNLYG